MQERVSLKFSIEELQALLELVDNQLFRMKYIDPRIPGHKANPEMLGHATSAVSTLRGAFNKLKGFKVRSAA